MNTKKIICLAISSAFFSPLLFAADGYANFGSLSTYTNPLGTTLSGTDDFSSGFYNGGGDIGTLTNLGTITSNDGVSTVGHGLFNNGTITTVSNSGTISGRIGVFQYINPIDSFINSGLVTGTDNAFYIYTPNGTIGSLTNTSTGQITSPYGFGSAIYLNNTLSNLSNQGSISAAGTTTAIEIQSDGQITTLTNSEGATISGGTSAGGKGIYVAGILSTLENSGTISAGTNNPNFAIHNVGTIYNINNQSGGLITAYIGIENGALGTISSITNTGRIVGTNYGIINYGSITTLNNGQGATGALTLYERLPENYNVIVSSPTNYGKLAVSGVIGTTTFGIYNGSTITKGTYASVLSGVDASNLTGSKSGVYNDMAWRLVLNSGTTWDLIAQGSPTNTYASVQQNANGLATVYNQQAAAYQTALSYDCQVYDQNNLCVSVGGRYTYAGPSPSSNQQAGLVILGYKPVQTFRVGAFADQSVNISTPSGFSQSKTSPMWGLFAKWHKNNDETGLGVQASAVTSASSLTSTRPQLFNTEAGSGTTQFNGQGYQLTTNYHQPVTNNTSVVPYLGLRYTRINAGAYTENTTATVTSPLSYNAMAQNTFSAIAGLGVRSLLAEKLTGTASVGIQQNLNYSMGNYAGTSNITSLESFSVQMPGNVNSMATATAGLFYDVRKNERIGLNVLWQQQPFIATNTTTAIATYTIGF